MENVEIAGLLNRLGDLLEIQGANPFRVRAYRNAVRTIENQTRPLSEMCAEGLDLTELPGIGEDIAGYVHELVNTGELAVLGDLESELPASTTELLRIEGLGPKRVKQLHDALHIESLDALSQALESGRIEGLKGFGAKTIEHLRQALPQLTRRSQRYRWYDAEQLVEPLLSYLRALPGIERVEAAGSYRRRLETVGDIDLLAICARAKPVMQGFTQYPEAAEVMAAGSTRGTIRLRSGLQVDLRILPARSYGAALHYFTGSKAHNIAIRTLGLERGLRISEYGVFRVAGKGNGRRTRSNGRRGNTAGRRVGGADENDVFRILDLDWIPPELREARGEIEAARTHTLPHLIELKHIRGDLQMHSTWSDGRDSIETMVRACKARGYRYCAITDHSKALAMIRGLDPRKLARQATELTRLARRVPGIRVLRALEVDIRPDGSLDLRDQHLNRLDLVVASIHSYMHMDRTKMTDRIVRAFEHPAVDILAHPTGRLINERAGYDIDLDEVLRAAQHFDVALELNAQPERLDLSDVMVRRAKEMGVRIAINTDAHSAASLRWMQLGVDQARRGWLEPGDVINTLPLARFEKWLGRRTRRVPRARPTQRAARRAGHPDGAGRRCR